MNSICRVDDERHWCEPSKCWAPRQIIMPADWPASTGRLASSQREHGHPLYPPGNQLSLWAIFISETRGTPARKATKCQVTQLAVEPTLQRKSSDSELGKSGEMNDFESSNG